MVKRVGLTGGIASGKTAVSDRFAALGVPVIDADQIARDVVQPGTPGLAQLIDHFGQTILLPSGELDRAQLRTLIFQDPAQRQWLNQALHPRIQTATEAQMDRYKHHPYLIWSVPLLIETQLHHNVDRILVVYCSPEQQLKRLLKRDGISEEIAQAMIASQSPTEERLAVADDVIENNSTYTDLIAQVDRLHQRYCQYFD